MLMISTVHISGRNVKQVNDAFENINHWVRANNLRIKCSEINVMLMNNSNNKFFSVDIKKTTNIKTKVA